MQTYPLPKRTEDEVLRDLHDALAAREKAYTYQDESEFNHQDNLVKLYRKEWEKLKR